MLPQFFEIENLQARSIAVKEGEELNLGTHTLKFGNGTNGSLAGSYGGIRSVREGTFFSRRIWESLVLYQQMKIGHVRQEDITLIL